MEAIIKYFSVCVIWNIIITGYCFIINSKNIFINHIAHLITSFIIVNIIKIFNQLSILSKLREQIPHYKNIFLDKILDFIKIIIFTSIAYNYNNLCINSFMILFFVLLCVNIAIIIIQFIVNLIKPNIFRNHSGNNFVINDNIYVNIQHSQNIIDYTTITDIICPICLDKQIENEILSKTICEHIFHKKCLIKWLQINNICPVCRTLI